MSFTPVNQEIIIYTIYLSTFLIATVNGMILLLLPLYALDLDTSIIGIGGLVAARSIGTLLVDLPAGIAIRYFGEKKLIQLSVLIIGISCGGIFIWNSWYTILFFMLLFGVGIGGWNLARHCFVSDKIVNHKRGRKMSKLLVIQRAGLFVGPVMGGGIGQSFGYQNAFLVATILSLLALILCSMYLPKLQKIGNTKSLKQILTTIPVFFKQHKSKQLELKQLKSKQHGQSFLLAVTFIMVLRLVRGSRQFILPLWGNHIGLNGAEIGLVFSLSAAIEVALLYVGGYVSDHWGRKWSALPSLVLLSFSLILMPLALNFISFLLLSLLAGAANGLGGGIIMTLGSDLAPKENRSTFLGAWRLMGDLSGTISPLLIGWIGSIFALGSASIVSGGIGLLGSAVMMFWINETLIKPQPDDQNKNSKRN